MTVAKSRRRSSPHDVRPIAYRLGVDRLPSAVLVMDPVRDEKRIVTRAAVLRLRHLAFLKAVARIKAPLASVSG
jgi:hypothetical protein